MKTATTLYGLFFLLSFLMTSAEVRAYTVVNTLNSGPGSLRFGIESAGTAETISFDTALDGATITLASPIDITSDFLTIDGGTLDITISGGGSTGIFEVTTGGLNVNLSNLTLTQGSSSNGGAFFSSSAVTTTFQNVHFIDNSATGGDGGAVRLFAGSHTFRNCSFIGNNCPSFGGGFHLLFGSVYMENVLFSGNLAGNGGGAYFRGGTNLVGCTFSGNRANAGGGAIHMFSTAAITMSNCIAWNNQDDSGIGTVAAFSTGGGTINCQSSTIEGSGGSSSWDASFGIDLGENLDTDPAFNTPISPADAPTTLGNYQLTVLSDALDNGGNAVSATSIDLAGNTRIVYGTIDRGPYEFCETRDTIFVNECSSYTSPSTSYTWTSSGVYSDTLTNSLGCDSVIVIDLTIQNSFNSFSITVCDEYTTPSGSETITASGVYNDTIPNSVSCDSILTITVTILESTSSTQTQTVCDSLISPSASYVWFSSGTYNDTLTNAAGCDSVITVLLTVNSSTSSSISPSACESYTSPSGLVKTVSEVFNDTIANSAGCDSVITINLTVNYPSFTSAGATECDEYIVPSGSYTITSSGSYNDTLADVFGCDSILILDVVILESTSSTQTLTVCDELEAPSGSTTWTSSGTYVDVITNSAGCDSTITFNLTVNTSSVNNISESSCESYTVPSGDETYTASGVYNDTIPNTSGCDSVLVIDLTILSGTSSSISETHCESYIPPSGGTALTASGTYEDTITNAAGCDSVITIDLTILNPSFSDIYPQNCGEYTSPSGLYNWTSSGTYSDTLTNAAGCDSIITVYLQIDELDQTVSELGSYLESNDFMAQYQWVNCDQDFALFEGDSLQQFYPPTDGSYAVILKKGACLDTTDCITIDLPVSVPTSFTPNGDGVNDLFILGVEMENYTVVIYNRWGDEIQRITSYNDEINAWDGSDFWGNTNTGTYYYLIEEIGVSGWVQVLR